jgi:transcriptional regulator with XRE-family HTH domain
MTSSTTTFADRLREARQRIRTADGGRLTQGGLATAVGVERNTVSRWENSGVRPKDPQVIRRLAEVLNVSMEYLFPGEGEGAGDSGLAGDRLGAGARGGHVPSMADPPRHPYSSNDALMQRLPPRAYEVIHGYVTRVEAAGGSQVQADEAAYVLAGAAATPLRSGHPHERSIDDMLADIESAWSYVAAVLRRDGRVV